MKFYCDCGNSFRSQTSLHYTLCPICNRVASNKLTSGYMKKHERGGVTAEPRRGGYAYSCDGGAGGKIPVKGMWKH